MMQKKPLSWNPEIYTKHSQIQFDKAKEALSLLSIKGNETVLDLGCGDGKLTALLAQNYFNHGKMVGIDNSPEMILHAKNYYGTVKNLSFDEGDAQSLPFENTFDLVLSFYVLHWVKDLDAALAGIARSLKKKGKSLLFFIVERQTQVTNHIEKMMESERWDKYCAGHTIPMYIHQLEDVVKNIKNNNFLIHYLNTSLINVYYDSLTDLENTYRAIPFVDCIPQQLRDDFYSEVASDYVTHNPPGEDGKILDSVPGMLVVLEKK